MLASVGCARRVSQRCHAPTRRTTGAGPQRGWSTLPVPPFPAKSCDDDDVEGRERYRGHGIVAHPTATNNGYGNNVTVREYHASPYRERVGPAAFLALGAVAATAKAGQYAVQGYNEWKAASLAEEQKRKEDGNDAEEEGSASQTGDEKEAGAEKKAGDEKKTGAGGDEKAGRRENLFANLFGAAVGSRYYEGGFEDQMTRREAALILGVRESSAAKRIKEAHRKLLILNHPDTGGSTFLSGKLNEAKELLLKGKRR